MRCTCSKAASRSHGVGDHRVVAGRVEPGVAEALGQGDHADRQAGVADQLRGLPPAPSSRTQASSVEPPPMSNSSARRPARAAAARSFPAPARLPRGARSRRSGGRSRRGRGRGRPGRCRPAAGLGGDGAQARTGPPVQAGAQACSASIARSIAAGLSCPGLQPLAQPHDAAEAVQHAEAVGAGRATSSRQLLVPRSSAANGGRLRRGALVRLRTGRAAPRPRSDVSLARAGPGASGGGPMCASGRGAAGRCAPRPGMLSAAAQRRPFG